MALLKGVRIAAMIFILCVLSFGLYINFSETGPNAFVDSAVMVCVCK